jgi:hypothetical protein
MLPKDEAAFYQLIYYQVRVASLINKKFLYRDKSYLYSKQNRLVAYDYAQMTKAVYDSIIIETNYFNNQLSGGKWKNMISMKPRDLPVFQEPVLPQIKMNGRGGWSVLPEGVDASDSSLWMDNASLKLPSFDNHNRQQYFIDLFLKENKKVDWTAITSAPWIRLSKTKGILNPGFGNKQERIYVTLDWNELPFQDNFSGKVNFQSGNKIIAVSINGFNHKAIEPNSFRGFIENNGVVSIYAGNYSRKKSQVNSEWVLLPYLGYTGNCLQAEIKDPPGMQHGNDTGWIKQNSAYIEYDFYTFSKHNAAVTIYSLPTYPLNNGCSLRYAVSLDEGPLQVVDFRTFGRSEEWKENVLSNSAKRMIQARQIYPGKHSLRIYAIDPGVILDRILIDLGGYKNAYSAIPETGF